MNWTDEPSSYWSKPYNAEIEAGLIGALLSDDRAYYAVEPFLRAECFYEPVLGQIYETIGTLVSAGQRANPQTLSHYFASDPRLSEVGGSNYLFELVGLGIPSISAAEFGREIYDLHVYRELIAAGEQLAKQASNPDPEGAPSQVIEEIEQVLLGLAEDGSQNRDLVEIRQALNTVLENAESAIKRKGKLPGITTGLLDLDETLGGLQKSDLIVLAGRPSMGKTALATNIALNAARALVGSSASDEEVANSEKGRVLFFSLEMSASQLGERLLAEDTGIPSSDIVRGKIDEEQFRNLATSVIELSRLPIFIDDSTDLTIASLRSRARRFKRLYDIDLIVVDYLQLLRGEPSRRFENRVQEISQITRGLKIVAKDLEVPVLALSQLSREPERRENPRPMLSDLRESGSIEQDADVVMLIYRAEYYLERQEIERREKESQEDYLERVDRHDERLAEARDQAEVIIAKHRRGPVGSVDLHFDKSITRFSNFQKAQ